jgi:uncharacterized SAM-binding protein YcdF (DUF218 family)
MNVFASKILAPELSPIVIVCELLIIAILAVRRRPLLARLSAIAALLVLVAAGNKYVGMLLAGHLESRYIPDAPLPTAQAIVVLSSDAEPAIAPQPTITVDGETANRLLFGVYLYRRKFAPMVILSGGRMPWSRDQPPMAEIMAQVAELMGVPPAAIIQEGDSANTYENAARVKAILQARRISRILLVTSAMHMPRALALFRHQGIEAIAAPCDFVALGRPPARDWRATAIDLIPDASYLGITSMAVKEYLGIAAYRAAGLL